jgi:hypothetical protein
VQAFILAFYAEMYGFPVTIYLLARIFNLDVVGSFWDGNLWVYLMGAPEAMLVSMAIGSTIAFLRKRRRGEKSDCLGESDQNRHATDTRRSIGQSSRRRRSLRSVTETIEEQKLRK